MGLPWTRAPALLIVGRVLGALLFVTGVGLAFWRGFRRAPSGRLERIAIAMVMFSLASAVLATIGRADVPAIGGVLVPVRYSVLLIPLHVGLLWCASPVLNRLWIDRVWSPVVSLCLAGACALLLLQQVAIGQAAGTNAQRLRATIERFLDGQADADMTTVIGEDLEKARRELEVMRQAGVYLFGR